MYNTRKSNDPFNEDNIEWRARLNRAESKKLVADMKFINVKKRSTVVMMGLELFHKHYGIPEEK